MPRRKRKGKAIAPRRSPSPPPHPQTPSDPAKCYLLTRLPPELRHRIYRLVLPPPTALAPRVFVLFREAETRERSRKRFRKHERVLGLARCCIQLFEEVLPIYYGDNRFSFASAYDLYRFLYMVGRERRGWIRWIDVLLLDGFQYSSMTMNARSVFKLAFDVLADCASLRHFGVGVSSETTDGLPNKRRQDLLGIREWGCWEGVRGMVDLDVRVQEFTETSQIPFGELDWETTGDLRRRMTRRNAVFAEDQVIEFERLLKEDFERPKVETDDEDGDGFEADHENKEGDEVDEDQIYTGAIGKWQLDI